MFFARLILSFSFFIPSRRTQNSFTTIRHIVDILFILIFISIVIYTEAFVHRNSSKQMFLKFRKFNRKTSVLEWTFNFIKKWLQHGCSPVKFVKSLTTSFFYETLLLAAPVYTSLFSLTCLYLLTLNSLYLSSLYTIIWTW